MEILEELADAGIDPKKLMPGTGACSLTDAIILAEHAVEMGCGGVLMLPPFYYKNPSEEGLFRFFAELIEEVGDEALKVYLYHIPPVAQVGFSLPLIGRLVKEFPNSVVGLKDSSGDWSNTKAILDTFPNFEVFPGSEVFLLDGLRNGAVGCISATANVSARAIRKVFDNWQGPEADSLQAGITSLRKAIQGWPMIPVLKALIAHYREDPGWAKARPPFTELPAAEAAKAVQTLAEAHGFRLEFAEAA
jgi:4-hydroxy-tetrahydrodipicolinate synthase